MPQHTGIPTEQESRDANARRTISTAAAVETIREHPGHTSAELAKKAGVDRAAMARRLPGAADSKTPPITRGQTRSCSVTGRIAMTWWPTSERSA